MAENQTLTDLRDELCLPVLRQCESEVTTAQRAALLYAPLLIVSTVPAQIQVLGFSDGQAVDCGRYQVPTAGGDAVARFLEEGLNGPVAPDVRAVVARLLTAGAAQLVAWIRPDRGEAAAYLVARDDAIAPMWLFTLTPAPEITH